MLMELYHQFLPDNTILAEPDIRIMELWYGNMEVAIRKIGVATKHMEPSMRNLKVDLVKTEIAFSQSGKMLRDM